MREERIQRRTYRILARKPARFGFTFDETTGALALTDLCNIPLFKRRDMTVEELTTALTSDSEGRFTVEDGKVRLTNPPAEGDLPFARRGARNNA